jgi:DNA-binding MarR family transcriptional regulator
MRIDLNNIPHYFFCRYSDNSQSAPVQGGNAVEQPVSRQHPETAAPTGTTADSSGFEASQAFLICSLANHINVLAERSVRQMLGLSLMEWRVLVVLAVEPAAPPGRIVAIAAVNKAAVSRAVNSLERRGLLERKARAPNSRRRLLYLTAAGMDLHNKGTGSRLAFEDMLLRGMSAAERTQFHSMLKQALHNIDGSRPTSVATAT